MTNLLRRAIERGGRFLYNVRNARYVNAADLTPVSGETLVQVATRRMVDSQTVARNLLSSLQSGDITIEQWRDGLAVELRRAHSQLYALGKGGWAQVGEADRAAVTNTLRAEFDYLRQFTADINAGALSDAQIADRMSMYGEHIRMSYWSGSTAGKGEAGYTQERRVLTAAEHCDDCEGYASQGWVEIGTLPPPGDGSVCGARCACEMDYQ